MKKRGLEPDGPINQYLKENNFDAALELLIRTYQTQIVRFCIGMLGTYDAGVDAGQEVFLAAFYSLPRYEPIASIRSWLFGIARNVCYKAIRDRSRWPPPTRQTEYIARMVHAEPQPIPGEISRKELIERAFQAFDVLDEEERTIALLRYESGFTLREISHVIGVSVKTVERGLRKALQKIREYMDEIA